MSAASAQLEEHCTVLPSLAVVLQYSYAHA